MTIFLLNALVLSVFKQMSLTTLQKYWERVANYVWPY